MQKVLTTMINRNMYNGIKCHVSPENLAYVSALTSLNTYSPILPNYWNNKTGDPVKLASKDL